LRILDWLPPRELPMTTVVVVHSTCLLVITKFQSKSHPVSVTERSPSSSLTECQRNQNSNSYGYSTRMNDIWSLGIILVNLVCGRNPWRQASSEDETFQAYVNNPGLLETILPISQGTAYILRCIFELDPRRRPDVHTLKEMVLQTTIFSRNNLDDQQPTSARVHRRSMPSLGGTRPTLQYNIALPTLPGLVPHQASCSSDDEVLLPITPYIAAPFDLSPQDANPRTHDTIYDPSTRLKTCPERESTDGKTMGSRTLAR
jgi:serine/threonine protein kinase